MDKPIELISDLTEGYSTQAKTTNGFWLTLVISSIIAILGHPDDKGLVELPFTLGKVVQSDFYSISICLISVIIIAFSAAMAQLIRTRVLIQRVVDNQEPEGQLIFGTHLLDYFDSLAIPSYTRVASISQYLQGEKQFHGSKKPNKFIRITSTILYILLKIATFGFIYFIPILALLKCWSQLHYNSPHITYIPSWILVSLMSLAFSTMAILFAGDIKRIVRVCKKIL